jgi:hypothetical protein
MIEERKRYYDLVNDWNTLPAFLDYFDNEAKIAKKELPMSGPIEKISKDLAFMLDTRFTQLQILNAAVEHFDKQLDKIKSTYYRKYLEKYQRALSSRDVDKYVMGEDEILSISEIINEISLMRNIFTSIVKSYEMKSFQINNITKLRVAGLEDSTID